MLLHNRKVFFRGMGLTIVFAAVLWFMFTPSFNGADAFHASDALFNSISKGSTYYIPQVREGAASFEGQSFGVVIFEDDAKLVPYAVTLLTANGLAATPSANGLEVSGDLGGLMLAATDDSDAMFRNDGDALKTRYGLEGREALYVWWKTMKEIKVALDQQKRFAPATFMDRNVIKRAIEVGYNYYGIEGQNASERWGIILFSLVFYVLYTMWWGYAIFFMFEGLGLEMKAGRKQEQ